MSGSAFAVTHHAFSSGAGRTSDGNGSHASTLKSPSYTKSVSWQHYLESLCNSWYGQCWTENEDTDAMWRIYSPEKRGVRVKTTIRKLFLTLYDTSDTNCSLKYFIGKVNYKDKEEIIEFMNSTTFSEFILGGQNTQFAEVLCTKRTAFSHENEIRLIVDDIGHKHGRGGLYKINITPEELFEEICLDPRLSSSDFLNLRAEIQGMGVTTNIIQSDLYKLDLPRLKM
ncbi:DUF2971 domain-containing protein [Klebsiella pneumoniae]|uniref:Uncharacterized protein n=5 Tax=Klebsiella pneumoniae TaxID=573 RepID=A0A8E6NWD2_KLEPN|nr:DUF2971 domain-containing protein [Klebsiella pneumoniae]MDZ3810609.1 DUF2971 domain-containing protein [Klebsiella pneumoniae]QVQ58698.1 hypothetical protein [Klebsiella pneumoniae]